MNFMKTLKTVNGETLMNTFIPPVEFVVKDLIAQGAHLLSGSPKQESLGWHSSFA